MTDTATVEDDRNGAPEGVTHSHADRYNEDDFAIIESAGNGEGPVRFTVPATCTDRLVRIEHAGRDRVIENVANPFAAEDVDLDPETDDVIWDPHAHEWVKRVVVGEGGDSVDRSVSAS